MTHFDHFILLSKANNTSLCEAYISIVFQIVELFPLRIVSFMILLNFRFKFVQNFAFVLLWLGKAIPLWFALYITLFSSSCFLVNQTKWLPSNMFDVVFLYDFVGTLFFSFNLFSFIYLCCCCCCFCCCLPYYSKYKRVFIYYLINNSLFNCCYCCCCFMWLLANSSLQFEIFFND